MPRLRAAPGAPQARSGATRRCWSSDEAGGPPSKFYEISDNLRLGHRNPGGIEAKPIPWHWQVASTEVTLPAPAVVWLVPATQRRRAPSRWPRVIAQRRGVGSPKEQGGTMASGSTPGKRTKAGDAALDRLGGSLDAAQEALGDLRRELSKGGRDVLKDLDALLRDARKNLRSARRTLVKDLEQVQKAATGRRPAARRAPAKRATTAARTGGASASKASPRTTRTARKA
jgi:hypothetical protein